MRAHPPRCARPVRPPPERNKNIQMGTHRHTHPQMVILIVPLQLCTYTYTHSQLCTVSRTPPGVPTPGDPRLQKRTGSFPRLVPVRRGAERQGGGAAASGAPLPPARPPSALTVDARLVRHGSVPRSARALGALGSALDPISSPGPGGGGGCGGDRPASRSFPGGAAGPTQRAPPPTGEAGMGAGTRGRACAHRAPCSGWAQRRESVGDAARLRGPVRGEEQGLRGVEHAWAHAGGCVCAP